jgi:N-acyl-phosphatidylethanolamine-hydrolysing phospholipase D
MILDQHSGTSTPNSSSSQASAERPAHHVVHPITGTLSFKNPWPSAGAPTASELLFGGSWLGWPKLHLNKHPKARELQVLDPGDFGSAKVRELKETAKGMGKGDKVGFARATWLGHAGMYVQIPLDTPVDPVSAFRNLSVSDEDGKRPATEIIQDAEREGSTLHLLFDPIFSERAGPTSYTGPGRIRPTPCAVDELPGVHAVLISHNQYVFIERDSRPSLQIVDVSLCLARSYDHLDASSIKAVLEKYPRARYFVPLGTRHLPQLYNGHQLIRMACRQQILVRVDGCSAAPHPRVRLVG